MYKVIFALTIVGVVFAESDERSGPVQAARFKHVDVDFNKGGQYGRIICSTSGKSCSKTEIASKMEPIPHNCQALCRNKYETTCASAHYDSTTGICKLFSDRCTDAELVNKPGDVYFHRLKPGETCTAAKFTTYVAPEAIYSDTYCPMEQKRCPGPEMYRNKPWKNRKRQFCLDKCSKILTCAMVDWVVNKGQNVNDENALGTCYHKITKCSDADLIVQEDSINYLRLLNSDNGVCPENRQGDKKEVYGRGLCEKSGRCAKTVIFTKLCPIPHCCQALCRTDQEENCAAAYYSTKDRRCRILSERCTDDELVDTNKEFIYFHRLKPEGETCSAANYNIYVRPKTLYSGKYCLMEKKRCPGPDMYNNKPYKNKTRQFCQDKCSQVLTCAMVDWVPKKGQNVNDENALGTCYHKITKCSDAELIVQEGSFNYLRLLKTDNGECPVSRQPNDEDK